jgi:hypothetical protein
MPRGARRLSTAAATLASLLTVGVGAAPAAIVPAPNNATGATSIATAVKATTTVVTSASFASHPPGGTPNGTSTSALGPFMPTNGTTFGILTSGDVNFADDPNTNFPDTPGTAGEKSADNGGGNVRGDTDLDVTVLRINLTVPQGANCLRFDFQFLSEEYADFVGGSVNDAFIAELDTSNWTTSGSEITAPNNFAFDPTGDVVSVNSSGATSFSTASAAGTTYDGATQLLSAATQITPGAHALYLSIFDQGDAVLDSAAFIDNLVVSTVANPQQQCREGAQPTARRMVGKGSVSGTGGTAAYAYILRCDAAQNANAPFEVRFGTQRFRLTSATSVTCSDDPAVTTPGAGFDTMTGSGTGTLTTGGPGTVQWKFVDAGLGGASDRVELTIRNAAGAVVFQGTAAPPATFPGSDQATGNNTAQLVSGT